MAAQAPARPRSERQVASRSAVGLRSHRSFLPVCAAAQLPWRWELARLRPRRPGQWRPKAARWAAQPVFQVKPPLQRRWVLLRSALPHGRVWSQPKSARVLQPIAPHRSRLSPKLEAQPGVRARESLALQKPVKSEAGLPVAQIPATLAQRLASQQK